MLDQAGEKMKEQQLLESEGRPVDQRETPVNPFLNDLLGELHRIHQEDRLDGFLWYMYGVVTRDIQRNGALPETMSGCPSAKESLIESVKQYPWNWSAWKDLADLCLAEDEVRIRPSPDGRLHSVKFGCILCFARSASSIRDWRRQGLVDVRLIYGACALGATKARSGPAGELRFVYGECVRV
jgi:hypothetical protein